MIEFRRRQLTYGVRAVALGMNHLSCEHKIRHVMEIRMKIIKMKTWHEGFAEATES